jgi:uncharacterized Zn-binding protein involved in type VI secretion
MPFSGGISRELSANVMAENRACATVASIAKNHPIHVATGGKFQRPPSNIATVLRGSGTVLINHKAVARDGDPAETCNDPNDAPTGTVVAMSTVLIGD